MGVFNNRRTSNSLVLSFSVIGVLLATLICFGFGMNLVMVAIVAALVPIIVVIFLGSFEKKKIALFCLLILNYLIPVLTHYLYNISISILMDVMICFNFFVILSNLLTKKTSLKNVSWDIILVTSIWLLYCILEAFNPNMLNLKVWFSSLRLMALFVMSTFIIVQISIENYHDMMELLVLLSILTIAAVIKAITQKFIGFTPGDKYFLYVMDGQRTHIIYYGIRYFSIFSDASNFAAGMGVATAVFFITGVHVEGLGKKIYWWLVAALAFYGLLISGTRSALPVPVGGILVYLVLVRDFKKMIPVTILLLLGIGMLAFTNVGARFDFIRRARTIFHREDDISYLVRIENRKALRVLMKERPFGNGLGLSGGRGFEYGDQSPVENIPTDSYYVQIWVETGVVGQCLYFAIILYWFAKGAIICFFKLKNNNVRGIMSGMLGAVMGIFVMSSNSEVFGQFPNGIISYTFLALVYMAPAIDREMEEKRLAKERAAAAAIAETSENNKKVNA